MDRPTHKIRDNDNFKRDKGAVAGVMRRQGPEFVFAVVWGNMTGQQRDALRARLLQVPAELGESGSTGEMIVDGVIEQLNPVLQ